jgi:FlaA1/EpsC-like NDP-sugar epimerase
VEGSFKRNVLIFGADDVGATLLKMLKNGRNDYNVVGFVDDEDIMQGTSIYGVRVLGASDSIPRLVQIFRVDEVFITGARLSAERMKSVLRYCKQAQVRHKVVPAVSDLLSGHVHLSKGRDVEISDLFGRQPVKLDLSAIQGFLRGKKVLVTGSGGSIGSELCRQIADYQPECLILVDKNENYLFEIQCELTAQFPAMTIYCNLCNVTNRDKLRKLFDLHKPDMVFHAAAHKHVPLSEDNPEEAVWNNILGSKAVADLAHEFRVDEFVMVSTDKAVNPTSIMGVTKRVAELYVQGLSKRSATRFVTVRFGNVLNSNGSVIPIFQRQISKGGPITITHPNVERYFMSISEAVQLILQAVTMGRNGEVFVLEMGKSIAIVDVATELILQAGLKPHEDIEIKFTGLRPGEKLFEELVGKNEELLPTSHTSIKTLKINEMIGKEEIDDGIKNLIRICRLEDFDSLLDCLKTLVPEFSPPSQANGHHEHLTNGVRPVTKRKSLPAHDVEPAMSE